MATPPTQPQSKPLAKARPYVSSEGHVLSTPPLSARFSSFLNDAYNFLGLYFVSLFSLDPYMAAQNSSFNTRGGGARSTGPRSTGSAGAGGRSGGGSGWGWGSGSGGGGGGAGGGGGPRRPMGTVDDVRGPECGSCG